MDNLSWQYVAGFLDGEGCIALRRSQNSNYGKSNKHKGRGVPFITIVQSRDRGLSLLTLIQSKLAREDIKSFIVRYDRKKAEHSTTYVLTISGWVGVTKFLGFVFPYLHIKKIDAQDLLRFGKVYPTISKRLQGLLSWESRRRNIALGYSVVSKRAFVERSS